MREREREKSKREIEREKKRQREKKKEREEKKRKRDFKYLLTLILTGGSNVTLINPIFSEWKSVGHDLTIQMMYQT